MNFNPKIAHNYARNLARPRQVGTSEEKLIAQEIAWKLEQSGFLVNYQSFQFSAALERVLSAEILLGLVLVLSTMLTSGINQLITLYLTGLLISLIMLIGPITHKVQRNSFGSTDEDGISLWSSICWKVGARYQTKNIVATLPESPDDRTLPHLYLVAHYDSKSQYLPLVIRIALFVLVITGSLVFSVLNVINLVNESFTPVLFLIGFFVTICGIPLLFLDYGNDSPGAIDDASGVGLVLHLAEIIAKRPAVVGKLRITALITSAEELAVKGALAYVQHNEDYLHNQANVGGLHVLNFDGIGVDGRLYLVGGDRRRARVTDNDLYRLVRQSAEELGIPMGRFSLPGAMFDHIPFAEDGYDAVSIIGIGKATWSIHTANDSPEKLHARGFGQAGGLAIRVIENLSGEKFNQE